MLYLSDEAVLHEPIERGGDVAHVGLEVHVEAELVGLLRFVVAGHLLLVDLLRPRRLERVLQRRSERPSDGRRGGCTFFC